MKKRTLVCFLIFTLCVFYTSIPNTVFGQEASLADKVFEKYSETLQREDIQAVLPQVLVGLKAPGIQALLNPGTIAAVVANPEFLKTVAPNTPDEFITLLKEDAELKAVLSDAQVQTLLQEPAAIDELASLLEVEPPVVEPPVVEPPVVEPPVVEPPVPEEASLAQQVLAKYRTTFQRADIQAVLPQVLVGLKSPDIQAVLTPAAINLVVDNPALLTQFAPTTPAEFITLLTEDAELQTVLRDAQVQALLQDPAAIDELAGLLGVGTVEPPVVEPPVVEPPVVEPPVVEPPVVEPPVVEPPVVEPPVVEPPVVEPPVVEPDKPADPFAPITPANESIYGKSRLGGLELNKFSGRRFVAEFFEAVTGFPIETLAAAGITQDQLVKMVVEEIAKTVPKGVPFPTQQIIQTLGSKHLKFFAGEVDGKDLAQGLDYENFGNAITPMLLELAWDDRMGDRTDPNRKYLTSDSLHLYARVPSANIGGVSFELTNGTMVEGQRISDPAALGSETVPYTFRLEEALAATNLPAWPALEDNLEQLFSQVILRHSTTGLNGNYIGIDMQPTFGPDGVVWQTEVDVTQGSNYYYFEVTLANPVTLEVLDRVKLAEFAKSTLEGNLVSMAEVLGATRTYDIEKWAMPDPRNLQLADRGIIDALFDSDFRAVAARALGPIINNFISSGKPPTPQELLNALGKAQGPLQNILLRNANRLTSQFEKAFDPMLASVFNIPKIDPASESMWVAELDNIPEGNHYLGAVVYDASGNRNPLDLMQGEFTVDTHAPEADIAINPGNTNTTGYMNDEGVYVATALNPGVAATLNITGMPTRGVVAPGEGYLLYQIIGLAEDGTPLPLSDEGDSSFKQWSPLTIEATMLASRVWDDTIAQLVHQGVLPEEITFGGAKISTQTLTLETVLSILGTPLGLGFLQDTLNPPLRAAADLLRIRLQLNDETAQSLVDILGATVDVINAVPLTFGDPNNNVVMPIQGAQMALLRGEYGIRALGIDTLFNVSSHTAPTRLRIVAPETDTATITAASIGDQNEYETGTIYANTTDNVTLTGAVQNPTGHPVSVMVQYMDANGAWQDIGEISEEALAEDPEFEIGWKVTDFDALIGAGDTVMVRAMATNALQLTDAEPMGFSIKLDAGVYPPEVLALAVDAASITETNPDSGAPKGTITINGYTPELTGPRTASVRFEIKGNSDADWAPVDTVDTGSSVAIDKQELVDVLEAFATIAVGGTDVPFGNTYLKWSVAIDTTTLDDTITTDSPGARDASKDDNRYTVRAVVIDAGGTEWASDAITMFSVDNDDDVAPVGPTTIAAVTDTTGALSANADGSYTVGGLIDTHDATVMSPMVTFTFELAAAPATYALVRFVQTDADGTETSTDGEAGVLEFTVDVGALENGTYMFHALAVDADGNVQTDASPKITVNVHNYKRPNPGVLAINVDAAAETNPDSGAPQGTITLKGYTLEQPSPQVASVRLEAKRNSDADWTPVGTVDTSSSVVIDDKALPGVLEYLTDIVAEGTEAGDRWLVSIDKTYREWSVSVDTVALALEDTITADSPGARDTAKDDNQYAVRAVAIDTSGTEWASDATAMFSVDNVDDVAPLGPTNIVTVTDADGAVSANADGSYTVGGLVDKYDDTVASPMATFTIEPTAAAATYASVNFVQTDADSTETITDGGAGVLEFTVDIGALENGAYMFHALAVDEFGNVQTDASPKITVNVHNYNLPDPEVLAINVDTAAKTNPDSGAPQGTITLKGYTLEQSSPKASSVRLEVKRNSDADWTPVGTVDTSSSVVLDNEALPGLIKHLTDIVAEGTEAGDRWLVSIDKTYREWSVSVDTVALKLEDTITADNPGARDTAKDDNQYAVRAVAIDASETEWGSDATAMFSVDNDDDVAPLGPTNITAVATVAGAVSANDDGSYTVGGLVDIYDDTVESPVATFTIEPTAARNTYATAQLLTDAEGLSIGEPTETAEGSGAFELTVDVGALENGTYMFHALAVDADGNVQADDSETDGSKAAVNVENTYRPAPEVLAVTMPAAPETNPDSGAPQGTITLNGYTPGERTSPPISSMRFEIKRKDADDSAWTSVDNIAGSSVAISKEELEQELLDFAVDVVQVAAESTNTETTGSGERTAVQIYRYQTYQKWSVEVDTTALDDTIDSASPAARDATLDANPYIVRAIAIAEADGSETVSPEGVRTMFSVDNDDDVAPLGPTNIVAVADVAGAIDANEDGSYTVGGIVDVTVQSPIAIFTIGLTAAPDTYAEGSIWLVRTDADGTQTIDDSAPGVLEAPTVDVGPLENGTYTFHALLVDKEGNVQADDSETDGSKITVHVLNFEVTDISDRVVIAVDGTDKPEPPEEPIPLQNSLAVSFTVANGSLAVDQLSAAVNGGTVASESAEDAENAFSLKVMELSALPDGMYTPDGMITQRNGSIPFPLATINLDNTGPTVTIEAPLDGHTVDSLPTVHATYKDGEGSGVDGGTGAVALARLQPPDESVVAVDQGALEQDETALVYTRNEQLPGGAYRVTVEVADILGNVGQASVEFAISGTIPTVAIQSPASGQTFEHGQPLISGEFSGAGELEVTTFTVDGADATPVVDGNRFSYTPAEALADGEHTVAVEITDSNGKTAQASVSFTVEMPKDTTPPVISEVAPTGLIKGDSWVTLSAVVTDEQSSVASVRFGINDKPLRAVTSAHIAEGRLQIADSFTAGTHTVKVIAISEGGTTEHSWTFTLVVDNVAPTITSITPNGTFRGGLPTISASANDESGVGEMAIVLMDSDGKEVEGNTEDDGEDNVEGITRLDFIPETPLDEGVYTIEVRATDTIGNSATAKGSFTIDFDTAAPVITMATPQQDARLTERRPTISITYADAESGVDVDSIRLVLDDQLINVPDKQKSASQLTYIPTGDLAFGQHTVKLEVSDMAHKEGNVSEKDDKARKANMAVYEFSFFVESEEGPVLASRPINAPNPFKENTRISFTLTRQSTVSIVIYDFTMRPVRVLVDNEVWDAGEYIGNNARGWDGTTTGGEDLARGIYFCQIIVADGFEPEYAILKLALTR